MLQTLQDPLLRRDYYANGKRGHEGGIPVWRPAWWNELGNDAEYREATKPRTAFKSAYYNGGHRVTVDGIPCRVSAIVKGWSPWMRRALLKGSQTRKEAAEVEQQFTILFPAHVPAQARGKASCVTCRKEDRAHHDGQAFTCWPCANNESDQMERDWFAYEGG